MGERYNYSSHLLVSSVNYLFDYIPNGLINSGNLEADIRESIHSLRECRMLAFKNAGVCGRVWEPKLKKPIVEAIIVEPKINTTEVNLRILSQEKPIKKGTQAIEEALLTINQKGNIRFNKSAIIKLNLRLDTQIDFGQDTDQPEKYFMFLTKNGIKPQKMVNPSEMKYQNIFACMEIWVHLKINPELKSARLEIGDKIIHEQDGQKFELFPLTILK